ncbi:hypothetical protein RRG08_005489 [Elysia crispata]|uniref:Uncharacterized protein n=1 Tax=Elysia crispata TaxID=231223 RepID=A0AAE0Y1F6_9GAST|nr:hypothetical protein RRG08_005489 [Elysia crispata]
MVIDLSTISLTVSFGVSCTEICEIIALGVFTFVLDSRTILERDSEGGKPFKASGKNQSDSCSKSRPTLCFATRFSYKPRSSQEAPVNRTPERV